MTDLVVIAHNLRSAHNVGSLLRTAEGLGVQEVILSGYTPYPESVHDSRLPHERAKVHRLIEKTALGASHTQQWRQSPDLEAVITELRGNGFIIAALEQAAGSRPLPKFVAPAKLAIVLGREREGLEAEAAALCDFALEIPMLGKKESFNVVQAAAMALYHCRFVA